MRKRLLCVSIAALALTGGIASAHDATLQNSLVFDPVATGPTTVAYNGQVFGAGFCRKGRAVDIFVNGALVATTFTDENGVFSVTGTLPPPGTEAVAVARKKKRKSKRHRHTCPAKTERKKAQ